jgi:hypothetical protein
MRTLQDDDNQRLLDGIGSTTTGATCCDSCINRKWSRPTNRAERALRFIVIARDTGQYAKNDRGPRLTPPSPV